MLVSEWLGNTMHILFKWKLVSLRDSSYGPGQATSLLVVWRDCAGRHKKYIYIVGNVNVVVIFLLWIFLFNTNKELVSHCHTNVCFSHILPQIYSVSSLISFDIIFFFNFVTFCCIFYFDHTLIILALEISCLGNFLNNWCKFLSQMLMTVLQRLPEVRRRKALE